MIKLKKLNIWLAAVIILLSAFNVSIVLAQEDFVITAGEDKVFTEFNYHETWFSDDPNNPEPWPDQREAYSEGNIASVSLIATPNHAGQAQAKTGIQFEWNLGQYIWEEVKDWPVTVTIDFFYQISAYWTQGNGSANAAIYIVAFPDFDLIEGAYDFIGYETGQSGTHSNTATLKTTITLEQLEGLERKILLFAYSQAHSEYKEDEQGNAIGTIHNSSANVTINSIKIEFNPTVKIIKAKMVSPTELGVAVKVFFPEESGNNKKFVKFNATINGQAVEEVFNVSKWAKLGKEVEIGIDKKGNFTNKTPLKIDLKKSQVEKFTENVKFELTAVAYDDSGESSKEATKEVEILLPVVIVHGILGEFGSAQPILFGDPDAILNLENHLINHGYEEKPYPTIYYFDYKSFWSCITDSSNLAKKVKQKVLDKTYAAKVNIVAHSMGGLISRHSIKNNNLAVNKLIMIGTPNKGSTEALMAWDYNWPNLSFSKPLRQLMPTYDFLYDSSCNILYKELQNKFSNKFLLELGNSTTSSTKYYSIYNSAFHQTPKDICYGKYNEDETPYVKSYGNGDGTVLVESAQLDGAVPTDISDPSATGKHSVLPSNPNVLFNVIEILSNK